MQPPDGQKQRARPPGFQSRTFHRRLPSALLRLLVWELGDTAGCLPPKELLKMPGSVELGEAWGGG